MNRLKIANLAKPGSISHASLRSQDLLQSFLDCIRDCAPRTHLDLIDTIEDELGPINELYENEDDERWASATMRNFILCDLWNTLCALAPADHYFGVHPGNSSDFGFWPAEYRPPLRGYGDE